MRRFLIAVLGLLVVAGIATPASAQSGATVTLLHGIPGVTVDVYVGEAVVIPGFAPADTFDLSDFAGATLEDIAVVPAGGDLADAVIEVPSLTVPDSGNWTVIAHLTADGTPTVTPFENDVSPIAAGEGRVTIRHTAAAPAVDILVGEDRVFTDLSNPNEVSADLPAGPLPAAIAPAGGDVLATVEDILGSVPEVIEGANAILYAVGSLEGETFTLYVQAITGLGAEAEGETPEPPTAVPTGNSPIGSDSSLPVALFAAAAVALGGAALAGRQVARARS